MVLLNSSLFPFWMLQILNLVINLHCIYVYFLICTMQKFENPLQTVFILCKNVMKNNNKIVC